jgi:hypothetical protein
LHDMSVPFTFWTIALNKPHFFFFQCHSSSWNSGTSIKKPISRSPRQQRWLTRTPGASKSYQTRVACTMEAYACHQRPLGLGSISYSWAW